MRIIKKSILAIFGLLVLEQGMKQLHPVTIAVAALIVLGAAFGTKGFRSAFAFVGGKVHYLLSTACYRAVEAVMNRRQSAAVVSRENNSRQSRFPTHYRRSADHDWTSRG